MSACGERAREPEAISGDTVRLTVLVLPAGTYELRLIKHWNKPQSRIEFSTAIQILPQEINKPRHVAFGHPICQKPQAKPPVTNR